MAVNLSKGERLSLTKNTPHVSKYLVGLGWDARSTDGADFDLDASAILCGADGKALGEQALVFYGQTSDPTGNVVHQGDNRTGAGDGDDETIMMNLGALPPEVDKIVVVVSIYEAEQRGQSFGQVKNAYVRLVDGDNPTDASNEVRYDLEEDYSTERAMIFAEIYRKDGEWRVNAKGQGYAGGLDSVVTEYGIPVA